MPDPEQIEIVKQGPEAIRQWREENPDVKLYLRVVDLRGVDLRGADLTGADLTGADLTGVDLRRADLRGADLNGAKLAETNLFEANLAGAYATADLTRADLTRADLTGATLRGADLTEATLREATLREADLAGAYLGRAFLNEVRGAEHAYNLETVRFIRPNDTQGLGLANDAHHFETCHRPWPEYWLDWERLRVVGHLPLFGISYTTLILIPVVFYGLALYNDKVELVRAWAEQVIALPDHPWHRLAPLVLERLHPRPIPSQSLLLLISTVLLAAGSTLYTFFSPSRIKEFSRDQWCDQIGRSLLHYWPLAWKRRYIRLTCAACYALGGAGALWVIGTKVWHTALFIVQHSTWPWR